MPLLYSAAVGGYHLGVRIAALWNPKARAWVQGREGLWERLNARREALQGCLWMHCASVGEFEQGLPVLEAIKAKRPELPVLLTFFSPSGYEARKHLGSSDATRPAAHSSGAARSDSLVTHVDYLPQDSASNAQRLVELIAPRTAIFVKYEFWYHHLHALKAKAVPTFLVSAIFRESQPFFKWYGGGWRAMLGCYERIFTQDEVSSELLAGIAVTKVTISGDTRFDRVMAIVAPSGSHGGGESDEHPVHLVANAFREAAATPVIVCGSTWPEDERLILSAMNGSDTAPRIIVAPHELHSDHLRSIEGLFPKPLICWSEADAAASSVSAFPISTLLVDRMGLLARLYKYGDIAYVGGGFGDGIHSLLEAAAWGKPVIFGPKHTKFAEAKGLIDAGGGFEVRNAEELRAVLDRLLGDKDALAKASEAAGKYVRERVGATERTVERILLGSA